MVMGGIVLAIDLAARVCFPSVSLTMMPDLEAERLHMNALGDQSHVKA